MYERNTSIEWFNFNVNETVLADHFKNHLLNYSKDLQLEEESAKNLTEFATRRFCGKSVSKKNFEKKFEGFIYFLRTKGILQKKGIDQFSDKLRNVLKQTLKSSADKSSTVTALPTFQDEPPEITYVLNHVLVLWPFHLYSAIKSREGRSLLRKFANSAQTALECALKSFLDNQLFRISLRVLWVNRAQSFFNANNIEQP